MILDRSTLAVIPNFRSASIVFDGSPETMITSNTHKRCLGKGISPTIVFEQAMLFQRKNRCIYT